MHSKLLFNLTQAAVFLIFYIFATSATSVPAAQPVEFQKINEGSDVNGAWMGTGLGGVHAHARARRPYRTEFCHYPYTWQRRECLPSVDPSAWQNVCTFSSHTTQSDVKYHNTKSSCPGKNVCMDTVDAKGQRFAQCVDVNDTSGQGQAGSPQVGSSDIKRAITFDGNTQVEFSVKIEDDIPVASVAAIVQSECLTFNVHTSSIFLCS